MYFEFHVKVNDFLWRKVLGVEMSTGGQDYAGLTPSTHGCTRCGTVVRRLPDVAERLSP